MHKVASREKGGEIPTFSATAVVRKPVKVEVLEDKSASSAAVDVRKRSRSLEEVSEALADIPGATSRTRGGAGSPEYVSLRGSDPSHTTLMIGLIPISSPDTGPYDLSALPLGAFQRVEVYRGGAPTWYGDGAIGGVVRFVPMEAAVRRLRLRLGAGSFGHKLLELSSSTALRDKGKTHVFGYARLRSARNDYPYVDDGQTRFDASDDRLRRQKNADRAQGHGLLHASTLVWGGRLRLLAMGHNRLEGIPGPLAAPTREVRRKLIRLRLGASYERTGRDDAGHRRWRLQLVLAASRQLNSLQDLGAELGTSKQVDSDDVTWDLYGRMAGSYRIAGFLEPTVVVTNRESRHAPKDAAAFSNPPRPSRRSMQALAIEPRLLAKPLGMKAELRPSARWQWSQSSISDIRNTTQATRSEQASTYRIGVTLSPFTGLSLAASLATGVRLPSIYELFGDRAYREPNPALRAESSITRDIGLRFAPRGGKWSFGMELRAFELTIYDMIRFERTSQYTVRPENSPEVQIHGLETGFSLSGGRGFRLTGSFTAMSSHDALGQRLPLRPGLQGLLRPEVSLWPKAATSFSIFAQGSHRSFVYLDSANLTHLPAQTLFEAGGNLSLWAKRVAIGGRVRNIFDTPVMDILSRPRPGREFRLALTLYEDLER